jgi:hypothetical protein
VTLIRLNEHELMLAGQNAHTMAGRLAAAQALFLLTQDYKRQMNPACLRKSHAIQVHRTRL